MTNDMPDEILATKSRNEDRHGRWYPRGVMLMCHSSDTYIRFDIHEAVKAENDVLKRAASEYERQISELRGECISLKAETEQWRFIIAEIIKTRSIKFEDSLRAAERYFVNTPPTEGE